jgi:hypothetical protein
MSFGRIKTRLRALINRKDFTDTLAGDFVLDAISALERDLRIGAMETLVEVNTWDGTGNALTIPANFIEAISLFTDEGTLTYVDLDTFLASTGNGTVPRVYTRVADRWLLKPTPQPDQYVYAHFYAETPRPIADEDAVLWTTAGFLATLYKAAELAADFFQMEPDVVAGYSQKAQTNAESLAGQALSEAWSGHMAIAAPKNTGDY